MNSEANTGKVRAWREPVTIPTYPVPAPDRNPMFLDKRVYQGSSGKVYPNPFTDRISDEKIDRQYEAVFLENDYIRLMILPEIGGRIHTGEDKTNGYDFFYRQNVIKPALVGLLGPWISGGVEFNWPQHHRPTTFMPVQHSIEEHEDGSRTVWLSEHEPMNRMKGMVGICLHPGKAIVEAKVRIYNRTPFAQTFLWWANAGIRVHDRYQSFFPPDVTFVADHAKRAMSWFPQARNFYYGVDYTRGVDLAWYKNIPVPTSYMVTKSNYDFFGGYDHARSAGVVHVANHHVAPGKKQWTWGNAEFGYAWDRELTDADGPYIELMAGLYTDNQPDFSWLQPYETKTISQFWYPIQEIGPVKNANRLVAVNLERAEGGYRIGVAATEELGEIMVRLACGTHTVFEQRTEIRPGRPFVAMASFVREHRETDLLLSVLGHRGAKLIEWRPIERRDTELPEPATEPPVPAEIATNEELYLTGLHLEQYRHATRFPEPYWQEALSRDPSDSQSNNALGRLSLRRGEFNAAEGYFRTALARLTRRNPNPENGEPAYNLGKALRYQNRLDEAYSALYKATWNCAWRAPAYYALATIDCKRRDFVLALSHLDLALRTNADHLNARNLKCAVLRRLSRDGEACSLAEETLALDPLDFYALNELTLAGGAGHRREGAVLFGGCAQICMDVALDYAEAGYWDDADGVIGRFQSEGGAGAAHPMLFYARGWFAELSDAPDVAVRWYREGQNANPDYCFPSRIEEMPMLERALASNDADARAHYYLGNLLYDKMRRDEAIAHWEAACRLDPGFSIPWRNLGIASFNVLHQPGRALECYEEAFRANPSDARLLYEFDQLRKRTGSAPEARLLELARHGELVAQRDDLTIELITLFNLTGQSARALATLEGRRFHPWEGGEGLASGQWVAAHLLLGLDALECGEPDKALRYFLDAGTYPRNLGEGKHLLTSETHLHYFAGVALSRLNRAEEARESWRKAASGDDETTMFAYYRALALRSLGEESAATRLLRDVRRYASERRNAEVKIDYFATSLPNFLLFEDDIQERNQIDCQFLCALASLGLGEYAVAEEQLRQVLARDANHLFARIELNRTRTQQGCEVRRPQ